MNSINDISIAVIENYLISNGWLKVDTLGATFSIWVFPGLSLYEITLPSHEGHKRFSTLLDDALTQLCSKEGVSREEIINRVISPSFDRMFVRVIADDVSKGRIPFTEGIDLYSSTLRLLKDTANSLHKFKDKNKHVSRFKNEIMMGQTQIGSYVVSLESPLYEIGSSETSDLFEGGKSLGRLINQRTFDRVCSISKFLQSRTSRVGDSTITDIDVHELTSMGITDTVCDSLLKLFGVKSHRDFEVSFEWSSKERIDDSYKRSVYVSSTHSSKIRDLSEVLKSKAKEVSVTLLGNVEDLHRSYKDEDGRAKLKTRYKNRDIGITFDVTNEIYNDVVAAHMNKLPVEITGEIHSFLSSNKLIAKFDSIDSIEIIRNGELDYSPE